MIVYIKEAEISPDRLKLSGLPKTAGELNIEISEKGAIKINEINLSSMRINKGIIKFVVDEKGNTKSIKLNNIILEAEGKE